MKRQLIIAAIAVVVIGLGIWWLTHRGKSPDESLEPITVEVRRGPLRVTVSATGLLEPLTTVEVKSRSGGEISKMYVEPGDYVQAGQIIAQLDPTELQSKVDQARAQADSSQARLAQAHLNAEAQTEQTTTSITEAQASLEAARARLRQAQLQLDQIRVTNAEDIVQAQAGLASAQARLKQAQAQEQAQPTLTQAEIVQAKASLTRAEQDLAIVLAGARPQELAQAQARVREAQAAADNAQAALMRQEALLAKGFVSPQSVEDSRRSRASASSQLEVAQQSLSLLEVGARPEEIKQARASLEQAQAGLETAQAHTIQVQLKRQDREAAEAALRQAEASLSVAEVNRVQITLREEDLELASLAADQAAASLRRAKSGRLGDAARVEDIRAATADLRRTQSQLDDVEYSFKHTTIAAPRDGVVLEKLVEEGTVVPAGTAALAQGTTIITLADITEMYVLAEVDEADIAQIRVTQPAEITVDALPGRSFAGEVVKVFPKAREEQNVVYFPVRIKVLDTVRQLRPGMTADVTLVVAEQEDTLLVPDSAIDRSGQQPTVQVLEAPDAEPVERTVKVGISDWEQTEILEGLKEGELLLLPAGAIPPPGMGRPSDPGRTGRRALGMLGRAGSR